MENNIDLMELRQNFEWALFDLQAYVFLLRNVESHGHLLKDFSEDIREHAVSNLRGFIDQQLSDMDCMWKPIDRILGSIQQEYSE